jgi:hypothetical protein
MIKQKAAPKSKDTKFAKLDKYDLADGQNAKEYLDNRPTKDFSTTELGALMQIPPGGAEPHHIRTKSRQFNRQIAEAKTFKVMQEGRTGGSTHDSDGGTIRRPRSGGPVLSQKNYKIDQED